MIIFLLLLLFFILFIISDFIGLLCGAVQFELSDLAGACWEFIDNCLNEGKGQSLIEPTRTHSHHQTAQAIFDKVSASGRHLCIISLSVYE